MATATYVSGPGTSSEPGCVVDIGAGTGYYLAAVLDRLPDRIGLALDISASALRLAARAHPRAAAVGADAWRRLPIADGVADVVLCVFAPRDGAELNRILRPNGYLVVCAPAPDHLSELIGPLGLLTVDERKRERLDRKLSPFFDHLEEREYRASDLLDHSAVTTLACMGPGSWHTDADVLTARVERLPDPVQVTLAATISTYRRVKR